MPINNINNKERFTILNSNTTKTNNKKESVNVSFTFTDFSNILVELESVRVPVSFRIRDDVYMKYKRLGKREKRLVRCILEQVIERVANGDVIKREGSNVIINMPINVALAVAKNESDSDEVLIRKIRKLERKLKEYSSMIKEYESEISKLRRELEAKDKRIKELEARLQHLRPEEVRARVEAELVKHFKSTLYKLVKSGVIPKEVISKIYEVMGW